MLEAHLVNGRVYIFDENGDLLITGQLPDGVSWNGWREAFRAADDGGVYSYETLDDWSLYVVPRGDLPEALRDAVGPPGEGDPHAPFDGAPGAGGDSSGGAGGGLLQELIEYAARMIQDAREGLLGERSEGGGERGGRQGAPQVHADSGVVRDFEEAEQALADALTDAEDRLGSLEEREDEHEDALRAAQDALAEVEDARETAESAGFDLADAADGARGVARRLDDEWAAYANAARDAVDAPEDPEVHAAGLLPDDLVWPVSAADPVLLFSGAFVRTEHDLAFATRGGSFRVSRVYHSQLAAKGVLGPRWRASFEDVLIPLRSGKIVRLDGKARQTVFLPGASAGEYVSPPGVAQRLEGHPSGWSLHAADGTVRRYDAEGRFDAILDRFGATTTVQRAGGRVVRIVEPNGRSIRLGYGAEGLLTSITDHRGAVVRYDYDDGRLSRVRWPGASASAEGPALEYRYADGSDPRRRSLLTRITRSDGGVQLENEYGSAGAAFARVVRQTAGAVTTELTYHRLGDAGRVFQRTDVVDPRGGRTEYHFSRQGTLLRVDAATPEGRASIEHQYDDRGRLTRSVQPDGIVTEYAWDSAAAPLRTRQITKVRRYHPSQPEDAEVVRFEYGPYGSVRAIERNGRRTEFSLNALGQPTERRDPPVTVDGRSVRPVTTWAYDAAGRLVREVTGDDLAVTEYRWFTSGPNQGLLRGIRRTANGRAVEVTVERDESGRITVEHRPEGTIRHEYDGRGRATRRTVDGVEVERWELDAFDRPVRMATPRWAPDGTADTPAELVESYTHDAHGRRTRIDLSADGALLDRIEIAYDDADDIVAVTQDGRVLELTYDTRGRVASRTTRTPGTPPVTETYGYDALGRLIRRTDAEGQEHTYAYDAMGRMVAEEDPDRQRLEVEYLGRFGHRQRRRSSVGDVVGMLELAHLPEKRAEVLRAAYLEDGQVAGWIEARARRDGRGRLVERIVAGQKTSVAWDTLGRLASVTDALGGVRVMEYDERSRLTSLRHTVPLEDGGETRFGSDLDFDEDGRIVTIRDLRDRIHRVEHDSAGRIRRRVTPEGVSFDYAYDALGRRTAATRLEGSVRATERLSWNDQDRPVTHTDAAGNTTRLEYDGAGRLTGWIDAEGTRRFARAYDAFGRPERQTEARGFEVRSSYDRLGRLDGLRITDPSGDESSAVFEYDAFHRVVRASTDGHVVERTYDSLGRMTSETQGAHRVEFRYDLDGLVEKRYPSGLSLRYERDALGRVQTLRASLAPHARWPGRTDVDVVAQFAYRMSALPARKELGNGVVVETRYDGSIRPIHRVVSYPDGRHEDEVALCDRDDRLIFWGDAAGGRRYVHGAQGTSRIERVDAEPLPLVTSQRLGRTSSASSVVEAVHAFGVTALEHAFRYDAAGNCVEHEAGTRVRTFAHDRLHRMIEVDAQPIDWDAAGHLVSDGRRTFRHDHEGRLVEIATPGGELLYRARYDAFGRAWQIEEGGEVFFVVYDGDRPIELRDHDDELVWAAVWGAGPDELLLFATDGQHYHAVDNLHGDVRCLTDAEGRVTESYRYGPYGDRRVLDGADQPLDASAVANPFGYLSRPHRAGLVDLRARFLHPELMRFTSPDPLGLIAGGNLYLYGANRPESRADRTGEFAPLVWGVAAGVAFGAGYLFGDAVINPLIDAVNDEREVAEKERWVGRPWQGLDHYASTFTQFTLSGAMMGGSFMLGPWLGSATFSAGFGGFLHTLSGRSDWGGYFTDVGLSSLAGLAGYGILSSLGRVAAVTLGRLAWLQALGRGAVTLVDRAVAPIREWGRRETARIFGGRLYAFQHEAYIPVVGHTGWAAGPGAGPRGTMTVYDAAGTKPILAIGDKSMRHRDVVLRLQYLDESSGVMNRNALHFEPPPGVPGLSAAERGSPYYFIDTVKSANAQGEFLAVRHWVQLPVFGDASRAIPRALGASDYWIRLQPTTWRGNVGAALRGLWEGRNVFSCYTSTFNAFSRANYHVPNTIVAIGAYAGTSALWDLITDDAGSDGGSVVVDAFDYAQC